MASTEINQVRTTFWKYQYGINLDSTGVLGLDRPRLMFRTSNWMHEYSVETGWYLRGFIDSVRTRISV